MTDLVLDTPVTENYTGSAVTYTVPAGVPRKLSFELWGGGAGGGTANNNDTDYPGGGAGNAAGWIVVQPGDTIKLEVAQGGRKGVQNSTGGLGGWPDGGNGGLGDVVGVAMGGGGGSTRIYVNNVLVAVAGGGGGSLVNGSRVGGVGGGTTGGAGTNTSGNGSPGGGGTQSAGGAAGTNAQAGSSMQGGHGYASGSSPTTPSRLVGGGGGGGYYGGGGGGGTSSSPPGPFGPGGGGSGYFNSTSGSAVLTSGTTNTSYDSGHRPSTTTGHGGLNSNASPTDGGDGAAYIVLSALDIPTDHTPITDYSTDTIYYAQSNGTMDIKLWGAGGGGGYANTDGYTGQGGGGGYVYARVTLQTGDKVTVRPGQGGRGCAGPYTGGNVALPDGGFGGSYNTAYYNGGGGGGSSRLYVNDVLVLVAGAGGGGRGSGSNGAYQPENGGAGGGLTGGSGYQGANVRSTGGTQSTGGTSGYAQGYGAYLQGGNGGNGTYGTSSAASGGGGGGGYYGGGGGQTGSVTTGGGGGGGSSYISTDSIVHSAVNTQGTQSSTAAAVPGNSGDSDYIAGYGVGGLSSGANSHGGDGLIVLSFANGQPGDASGLVGTVTVTAPAATPGGGLSITALASPLIVTTTAPAAVAGVYGVGVGALPTITLSGLDSVTLDIYNQAPGEALPDVQVQGNIVAGPIIDAFITIDLEAALGDRVITAPDATVAGAVDEHVTFPTVSVVAIQGFMHGDDQSTSGALTTVTVSGIEATALQTFGGSIGTVNLSVIDATVTGDADLSQNLKTVTVTTPSGSADANAITAIGSTPPVYTTPVEGVVFTGEGDIVAVGLPSKRVYVSAPEVETISYNEATGDLTTISMYPVFAIAHVGDDVVAVGDIGTVLYEWTNTNDQQAGGGATITPPPVTIIGGYPLFGLVTTTVKPEATMTGGSNIDVTPDLSLSVSAPTGVTERAVSILAPIGTVYVGRINGYTNFSPDYEGDAQGIPLDAITVTAPEASGFATGGAIGEKLPIIFIAPVDPELSHPADTSGDIGEVDVTSPEADGTGEALFDATDLLEVDVSNTEADATGEALYDVTDDLIVTLESAEADGTGEALFDVTDMPTVLISVPVADVGASAFAGGKVGYPIQVIPVVGLAFGTSGAYGSLGTVMVSPPEAGAIGDVLISGKIGTVILACPDVTLSVGVDFEIPIDVIVTVIPPEAFGGETVFAVGEIGTVYLTVLKTSTGSFNIDEADALIREVETYLAYMEE